MAEKETWTPYGLEHLRSARLKRRRGVAIVLVLAILLAYFAFARSGGFGKTTDVCVNGVCGSKNIGFDIGSSSDRKQTGPDATIAVSPGKTARVEGGAPAAAADNPSTPPPYTADPVDWQSIAKAVAPLVLLAAIAWLGFRRRAAPEDEVNFGVYKGAMPLEMITASHAHLVLTGKTAKTSLVGKGPKDHVPDEDG